MAICKYLSKLTAYIARMDFNITVDVGGYINKTLSVIFSEMIIWETLALHSANSILTPSTAEHYPGSLLSTEQWIGPEIQQVVPQINSIPLIDQVSYW